MKNRVFWQHMLDYAKYFKRQTVDYELSIILQCVFYQFHRSLAMKLTNLRADKSSAWDVFGACLRAHEQSHAFH